ncbi:MAG: nucleotidyltransferase family protein [Blastocatellia bacterium]
MFKIRHALIMAAGRGQRMMPLTDVMPKPMAPYQGSTLIARGMSRLASKLDHIHVTVGYKGAMLAQHVIEQGASSVFNTEGRGNCWWIYNTLLKYLDEPVCVLTCDNVVDLDFQLLEDNYRELDCPPCMLVPVKPVEGLDGDYVFHANHVVTEVTRDRESEMYCSGIQVLNPAKINALTGEGSNFYSVWNQLIVEGQLLVSSVYPERWYAVDTLEQLVSLNSVPAW